LKKSVKSVKSVSFKNGGGSRFRLTRKNMRLLSTIKHAKSHKKVRC
jgi:hypothetical protein